MEYENSKNPDFDLKISSILVYSGYLFIFEEKMKRGIGILIYWACLTLFGLFAVYSTSIWKSFDQSVKITIIQNIESVKAFNTLLDETIIKTTAKILEEAPAISVEAATPQLFTDQNLSASWETVTESSVVPLPQLDTLQSEDKTPVSLVESSQKHIKSRNNYKYFSNQVRSLIISLLLAIIVYLIPMRWIKHKKTILTLMIGVTLFQFLVFIPFFQVTYGTSRGWIDIGIPGVPNMQPSEFFKMGYIFFMAYWITKRKNQIASMEFFVQFALIHSMLFLVLLAIPDFGTMFILGAAGVIMARYYGFPIKRIWLLGAVAVPVLLIWVSLIWLFNTNFNYAFGRLTTWAPTSEEKKQKQEKGELWQLKQGLIAVGGGGFFGQGYGKGLQKMGYLPEAHSDMIFDAFSEEIGFLGNILLLALYFGLFYSFLKELTQVKDPYFRLAGIGLVSLLMVQVFVHIGVNLGILPNTGLTLPFISHGGTALMINFIELTLMFKILNYKE